MKSMFLIWAGWAMLIVLALTSWANFFSDFKTGLLLGAAVVVFVVYPAYIRNLLRRVSALERSEPQA